MVTDISKPTVTLSAQTAEKSTGRQTIEILQIIGDVVLLILKIFYYIGESVYKKFAAETPEPVEGKVVLITGTGHGIGRQLAYQYASEGALVVGWDVNEKGNEETFREIIRKGYRNGHWYTCDVSNRDQVLQLARRVEKEVGEVDVLINNAGIMPCHPFQNHTPEEIEKIFGINVFAHFWTIEAFLPGMQKRNRGHITALSSCAGLFGIVNLSPYCGSKFAVRGLMEGLSEELRLNPNNGITLSIIYPYMTNTGLCKKPKIRFENFMRMMEPEEVAVEIMKAQRLKLGEVSVPNYLLSLNNHTRLLPYKAQLAMKDFFDAYVDSDL